LLFRFALLDLQFVVVRIVNWKIWKSCILERWRCSGKAEVAPALGKFIKIVASILFV